MSLDSATLFVRNISYSFRFKKYSATIVPNIPFGLNKQATREQYGDEQVHVWRRSYDVPPPNGESLELTAQRTIPYLENTLLPSLHDGNGVFVAAHGNSLRSIIMHLDGLSRDEVLALEVPTGVPIVYELVDGTLVRSSTTDA